MNVVFSTPLAGSPARAGGGRWFALLLATGLLWAGLTSTRGADLEFMNNFADRQTTANITGQLDGDNLTATVEPNEPRHGGKPGGHSVWVSWLATADGVATFSTDGSTFDTLLSAYYFDQPADATLDKLVEAARNDDEDPLTAPTSLIQFGARSGVRYHIAVDGYVGASGNIRLRWAFVNATSSPPIIVSVTDDQAARQGDPVTLTVNMQTSPDLDLQWRFNGDGFGATGPTLLIPSLQPANVGRYTLRVRIGSSHGNVEFETAPVELQINSDGQTNALGRDKLLDAVLSPLIGSDGSDGGGGGGPLFFRAASAAAGGVVRGYNGSQIFDTTFATSDPNEPVHCIVGSTASYWLAYQPPTNGTVTLDTIGSSYDTLLAVYTYDPPLTSYSGLIPITCDNDSVAPLGAARVEFAAVKGRSYALVVGSVNGARGTARLNYLLDPARPPQPPTMVEAPTPRTVAAGQTVLLSLSVTGSPPMRYVWKRDGALLSNALTSSLLLSNVAPSHSGNYSVTIRNDVGLPLTAMLPLRVVVPPRFNLASGLEGLRLNLATVAGHRYIVEQTAALGDSWQPWPDPILGDGAAVLLQVTNLFEPGAKFFRLRVE